MFKPINYRLLPIAPWQRNYKSRSFVQLTFDIDRAIRHLNTGFHHGQAKTKPAELIDVAGTVKLSKDAVQLVRRNPDPVIAYRKGNCFLGNTDVHLDLIPLR